VPVSTSDTADDRPGLTACSLCAGETLEGRDDRLGGQAARVAALSDVARVTTVECLDECERGDVLVVRPGPGVLDGPVEREVGDGLPARLGAGPVRAPGQLLVLGDRRGLLVLLGVPAVHRRGHDVVLPAGDEQQRCAVLRVVDPGLLVAGLEVRDQPVAPHPGARGRDGVLRVHGVGVLAAERVREGVVELLGCEGQRLVPARRVGERGQQRLELRGWRHVDVLGRRGVDHHAGGAQPAGEQQLGQRAAEGVADDDRRLVQALDHGGQVVDGLRDGEAGDDLRLLAERLDLDVEAGVGRCDHPVPLRLVVGHPVLPGAGCHPEAVHEHDGVGCGGVGTVGGQRCSVHGDSRGGCRREVRSRCGVGGGLVGPPDRRPGRIGSGQARGDRAGERVRACRPGSCAAHRPGAAPVEHIMVGAIPRGEDPGPEAHAVG
jgi:hypothetical protein